MSDVVFDYRPPREKNEKYMVGQPGPATYAMVQQATTVVDDPRLQKLNILVAIKHQPQLYKLLHVLNKAIDILVEELPDINPSVLREDAARIARKMLRSKNKRGCGRRLEQYAVTAAAVALALHGYGVYDAARTVGRVLGVNIDHNKLASCLRSILKHHVTDTKRLVARHVSILAREFGFQPMQEFQAQRIASLLRGLLQTRPPHSIAATAVYIVGKLYGTIDSMVKVAEKVGISDATIRNVMKAAGLTINYHINGKHVMTWRYGDKQGVWTPAMLATVFVLHETPELKTLEATVEEGRLVVNVFYEGR